MKTLIIVCLVCVCLLSTISTVLADDIFAPSWRGSANTTSQGWDSWNYFPTMFADWWAAPSPGLAPGYPTAFAYEGASVLESYQDRDDVLLLTGDNQIKFDMPNFENENPLKKMWVQVTFIPIAGMEKIDFVIGDQNGEIQGHTTPAIEYCQLNDGWRTDAWSFDIWPNPDEEYLYLSFHHSLTGIDLYPTYVDQVVIDTICVPEPTTICLLLLGAVSLVRTKK